MLNEKENNTHSILRGVWIGFLLLFLLGATVQMTFSWADLNVFMDKVNINVDKISVELEALFLDTTLAAPAWQAGRIWFDTTAGVHTFDTKIGGVRIQAGEEIFYPVYNNSGDTIYNGILVYAAGRDTAKRSLTVGVADNRSFQTAAQVLGWMTHDCPNLTFCKVTRFGKVRDINTSMLTESGILYLDTGGLATNTAPVHPNQRVFVGVVLKSDDSVGVVQADINNLARTESSRTEPFNSTGIGAGTYYVGGSYQAPAADANLTTCSDSQAYGSSGNGYHAHPFIVAGGPGSVTGGVIGLYVTGSSYDETTGVTATINDTLSEDITIYSLDEYDESSPKFNSTITFQLYTVSGTPSACTFDFNYGYAKYEDFSNQNFTFTNVDCSFRAGANDNGFRVEVLHHKQTGWTYSAAAFDPGNGIIITSSEMEPNDNLVNTVQWTWERAAIDSLIMGGGTEGLVTRITTGQNNSVTSGRCQYACRIESLE